NRPGTGGSGRRLPRPLQPPRAGKVPPPKVGGCIEVAKPLGPGDLRHVRLRGWAKAVQLFIGRVPIARGPNKGDKRPHNPQIYFTISHYGARKDARSSFRDVSPGDAEPGPRDAAARAAEVNVALDQGPHRSRPARPGEHGQHRVGLLPGPAHSAANIAGP